VDDDLSNQEKKARNAIGLVNEKFVYWNENDLEFPDKRKEFAFRFLLLINILEDNKLKRKFDFSIWNNRSLEHIYPKSKKEALTLIIILNIKSKRVASTASETLSYCIKIIIRNLGQMTLKKRKNFILIQVIHLLLKAETCSIHFLFLPLLSGKRKEIIENKKKIFNSLIEHYGLK
jgi:hypothetical protein